MSDRPMPKEFPKIEIGKAERYFRKILESIYNTDLFQETVAGDNLEAWTVSIVRAFSKNVHGKINDGVYNTMTGYLGKTLSHEDLRRLARRFASNFDSLMLGRPCPAWHGHIPDQTWTALQFMDMYQQSSDITFRAEIAWGTGIGEPIYKATNINQPSLWNMMYRIIGRKHSGNPRELVGLYIWGEVFRRSEYMSFGRWTTDSRLDTVNNGVLSRRRKPCPKGYTHLCVQCPVGADLCDRACRPGPTPTAIADVFLGRHQRENHDPDASTSQGGPEPSSGGQPDAVDESGPGYCSQLSEPVRTDRPGNEPS